ncbi:MAG TPA: hypothetical protein VGR26_10850 [Acidimicrobiales bacterium]|nr:hypothetical protein [Acidimicrobiales bacterium]
MAFLEEERTFAVFVSNSVRPIVARYFITFVGTEAPLSMATAVFVVYSLLPHRRM